jgi:hypothetical protein
MYLKAVACGKAMAYGYLRNRILFHDVYKPSQRVLDSFSQCLQNARVYEIISSSSLISLFLFLFSFSVSLFTADLLFQNFSGMYLAMYT